MPAREIRFRDVTFGYEEENPVLHGISFGLALFPVHGKTPEELIRRADQKVQFG